MRSLATWFSLYEKSHQNPTNKAIHYVAVPAIYFCVLGLLVTLAVPTWLAPLDWALVALVPVTLFYLSLELRLALLMGLFSALCWVLAKGLQLYLPFSPWLFFLGLFVLAWIGQFYGHHVEGRKPSFFEDLGFLLIGPAWVIRELGGK